MTTLSQTQRSPSDPLAFTIRPLSDVEEFRAVETTQAQAWNVEDLTQIVPTHVTLTAQKNGGLVAGAFDESGRMLGFVFGFIGLTPDGKFKHCSHMAGVLPAARQQNVGYALKLFQRDYVHAQGLDLITWTFDPLESLNANLNIGKLGTIARTYYQNLYGDWLDGLNKGIPTDRFEVEWWIDSVRVARYLKPNRVRPTVTELLTGGAYPVLETRFDTHVDRQQIIHFGEAHLNLDAETLILEIPVDFQAIKQASMDLAKSWRMITRQIFVHYFAQGYSVAEFISEKEGLHRRNYYIFRKHVPDLAEA